VHELVAIHEDDREKMKRADAWPQFAAFYFGTP
jgi:hypothetical protein